MNILIHGFNVRNPDESIGRLRKYFDNCHMFNYGWRLFSVLWHNRKDAKRLKKLLLDNPESNGCAIAVESVRRGGKIRNLICINPALKKDTVFPEGIERIIVIYTKHDVPTRMAAFCDKIPFLQILVPNSWGAMGSKGPKSIDRRLIKIDSSDTLDGHSDFLEHKNLMVLTPEVKKNMIGDY